MRGCALVRFAFLLLAGCTERRALPPDARPAAATSAPAPRPFPDGGGQLQLMGAITGDGGLAGMVGLGTVERGGMRNPAHYPDWPRSTPPPPYRRAVVDFPDPPADAEGRAFHIALRTKVGLIRSCYEPALRGTPTLSGEVTLNIALDREGKVASVAIPASGVGEPVSQCLRARLARLRFPPPARGTFQTSVTLRLHPAPSDAGAPTP